MSGTIITLSTRTTLDDVERLVRGRVKRDGQVAVAGKGRRQVHQLRLLADRLRDDPALGLQLGPGEADGVMRLLVGGPATSRIIHGRLRLEVSYWGAPKVGDGARASE
jgi:hypothetical protein